MEKTPDQIETEKRILQHMPSNREIQRRALGRSAKAQLEMAFHKLGGVDGLVKWGKDNRTDFYKLWSKIIPLSVEGKMAFERLVINETPAAPTIDLQPGAAAEAMQPVVDAVVTEIDARDN